MDPLAQKQKFASCFIDVWQFCPCAILSLIEKGNLYFTVDVRFHKKNLKGDNEILSASFFYDALY